MACLGMLRGLRASGSFKGSLRVPLRVPRKGSRGLRVLGFRVYGFWV